MVGETLTASLLTIAWLLPLVGFAVEMLWGRKGDRKTTKWPAWCAVGCIGTGFLCSTAALLSNWSEFTSHAAHGNEQHDSEGHDAQDQTGLEEHDHASVGKASWQLTAASAAKDADATAAAPSFYSGTLYTLATFGSLVVSIDYYIDSLTLVMFTMVTLIATCIHLFAIGYMSDELTDEYVDHFAHTSDGKHVHRQGRFYRFFAFMSLFCFFHAWSRAGWQHLSGVRVLGIGWHLQLPADWFLHGTQVGQRCGQQGVHHEPSW